MKNSFSGYFFLLFYYKKRLLIVLFERKIQENVFFTSVGITSIERFYVKKFRARRI